jgi:DNA uptake protein ComE-like DNA-binding protein
MGRRHWLDPLARRLLVAAGQIQPQPAAGAATSQSPDELVERELLALKLAQEPTLRLRSAAEVRHAAALGWRLDVNRATASDWLRLPEVSGEQVDLLQRLRAGGVQLSGPEDLLRVLGVDEERIRCWEPLLEFRWYGLEATAPPGPLDLNRASAADLQSRLPGWPPQRCAHLLEERRRGAFRDLADLQARLQLPPSLVEDLIGRVCFGPDRAGPSLPPRPKRSGSS